jgi:hypothetical protein
LETLLLSGIDLVCAREAFQVNPAPESLNGYVLVPSWQAVPSSQSFTNYIEIFICRIVPVIQLVITTLSKVHSLDFR